MKSNFWKVGHLPTLFSAFLYFDLSFMVWVLLGPLGVQIAHDLNLNAGQTGLMVATPILSGAFLRIFMGVLVDHLKPKRAGLIGQAIVIFALAIAGYYGIKTYTEVLILGTLLGFAGASFAVALPLASSWYPSEHQGTALGVAGIGNSGTVLAALIAPSLAVTYGWNSVFNFSLIPLCLVFAVYLLLAKDGPRCATQKPLHEYFLVLKDKDTWWFMLFYSVTFGGFVGLAASLTIYFNDEYKLGAITAGYFAAASVFSGSLVRPLGGFIADRVGGIRTLMTTYALAIFFLFTISLGFSQIYLALAFFIACMLTLGIGNGAVFQLVPQRFSREIGVITGLVGMAGGVGGFCLASALGYSKQFTGNYQMGFSIFTILAIIALTSLIGVKTRWRKTWRTFSEVTTRV